jgi:hypothetical protein
MVSFRAPAVCLAAILLLPLASAISTTQSPSISGRVVDAAGTPIPGVSVTTTEERGGKPALETTGSDGTYQFKGMADGMPGSTSRLSGTTCSGAIMFAFAPTRLQSRTRLWFLA